MTRATLRGTIDSFLGAEITHRSQLYAEYQEYLQDFAQRWLDAGYPDVLTRVAPNWIRAYLVSVENRSMAHTVLENLFFWAQGQHLIGSNPMDQLGISGSL